MHLLLLYFPFPAAEEYLREADINAFQTAMSQSRQGAHCALGVVFPGLFGDSGALGVPCMLRKSMCSDLLGEPGGGDRASTMGRQERGWLSLSPCYVLSYNGLNPSSSACTC